MSDMEKKHCHSDCDCGCEHDHEHCEHEGCDCGCEDEDIVTLTMDNGKSYDFYSDGTIEYKGKYYCAFEPAEEVEGLDEGDVVIFELSGDDEETAELIPVEDEAILDAVFQEFCRIFEEEEMSEEAESLED